MIKFQFFKKALQQLFKRELVIFWIFSVLLALALIALANTEKMPVREGDFIFLSLLTLLVALYRPRWVFFVFVGLVPLENIILASGFIPLQLRPYQFVGAVLAAAVIILWLSGKLKFKMLQPRWIDWLIFSLAPLGFLSLVNSPNRGVSLKQDLVLLSFILLYYLTRTFIRNKKDLFKAAFFFAGSWLVVELYGFYQVLADKFGKNSFEVMFGRPNSTFTEADWLGIFLCFALAILLSFFYYCHPERSRGIYVKNRIDSHSIHTQIPPLRFASVGMTRIIIYIFLFLNITLLILTLSRSAWIGAAAVIIIFLLLDLFRNEKNAAGARPRMFFENAAVIALLIFLSLFSIYIFKLSKFDIFDRARSAATSQQKITIACENGANIPQIISSVDELPAYNCRHINLEEIDFYKSRGGIVAEIFRKDPNVLTRSAIYKKSWEIIREHPILGVGFGTISQSLGADERGAGLNESNIFLQVWAGSGILGLIAFVTVIGYLFIFAFRRVSPICPLNKIIGCPVVKDDLEKTLNIFLILSIISLMIPNLFNAGLLMGLVWLGLAIFVSVTNLPSRT